MHTVLFATDSDYVPHLATAIYSLLKNNSSLKLRIIIFTVGLDGEDQKKLKGVAEQFGACLKFEFLEDHYFDGLVLNHHFQKSNYYRLFAADLIEEKSCLYLDADIVVTASIERIFGHDLSDYFLAAVENPGFSRHEDLGMRPESKYFNSGVMLLNLEKWREDKVKDAVISLIKKKPDAISFVDQCGLNGVIDGRWLELGREFNFQSSMVAAESYADIAKRREPVILHFTGSDKPWHINNKHKYKSLYWSYRNRTPYKSFFADDITPKNLALYALPSSLEKIIKSLLS
jgi:lipopolysaccharide biosynthesis glycosyltransferase